MTTQLAIHFVLSIHRNNDFWDNTTISVILVDSAFFGGYAHCTLCAHYILNKYKSAIDIQCDCLPLWLGNTPTLPPENLQFSLQLRNQAIFAVDTLFGLPEQQPGGLVVRVEVVAYTVDQGMEITTFLRRFK